MMFKKLIDKILAFIIPNYQCDYIDLSKTFISNQNSFKWFQSLYDDKYCARATLSVKPKKGMWIVLWPPPASGDDGYGRDFVAKIYRVIRKADDDSYLLGLEKKTQKELLNHKILNRVNDV